MNIWTSRGNGVISLHGLTSPNFSVCPKPGSRFASSSASHHLSMKLIPEILIFFHFK
jgi:hypothetical protein